MADIALVGLSYKTASVEVRECFSVKGDALPGLYSRLSSAGIDEAVYIATCNRVEVYIVADEIHTAVMKSIEILKEYAGVRVDESVAIYKKYSHDAVRHLLSVVSSLDSMVLGENEIVGQVKSCYSTAVDLKRTGPVLNRLIHTAFRTSKRVRTETGIAKNPVSIAYIVSELSKKIFSDMTKRKVLLVGAGEMGSLILKYLIKEGIGRITIANRSLQNAEKAASELERDISIIPLEDIMEEALDSDIIIGSVSVSDYIIDSASVKELVKRRKYAPLFMIDIGVPRNFDPGCSGAESVFLYNIDDLKSIADENKQERIRELEFANVIVEEGVKEFFSWYNEQSIAPAIASVQMKFDEIRSQEIERYRRTRLKHISDEDFEIIKELTEQIMTKTLHNPIVSIKRYHKENSSCGDEKIKERTEILKELFLE